VPTASRVPTPGTPATAWGTLRGALGRRPARRRADGRAATACYVAGGLLLVWTAGVHFHLWAETDGYRTIPTIGPLFLLQSIAGIVIGAGVVVLRRVWAAAVGAGFAVATLAGFLVSVSRGLFGFQDSWLAPYAKEAFAVEVAAAALLIAAAVLCLWAPVQAGTGSSPAGGTT
jgi:hypothetical protein